jgi:hypothetical protein
MEMPNAQAVEVGKSNQVKELPIPAWALQNFSTKPNVLLNPLNIHASSAQMADGYRKVAGKRIWPWQRKKVNQGASQIAFGRTTLYQPLGYGRG